MQALMDRIKKNLRLWLGLLVLLIITVFVIYIRGKGERIAPKIGSITEAVYALGTVKSNSVFALKLGITTGIQKLYVRQGDKIQKNAPFLRTLEGTVIRAPFTGTVTRLLFNEGESVIAGSLVLIMQDLEDRFVQLSLDQNSALRIDTGQKAVLSFEHIRGQTFKGKVTKIYPSEGQFLVQLKVKKLPPAILPEMTADVAVEVATRENVLLIPITAMKSGQVVRYRDGKKKKLKVKAGAIDGKWVEITDDSIVESDLVKDPFK